MNQERFRPTNTDSTKSTGSSNSTLLEVALPHLSISHSKEIDLSKLATGARPHAPQTHTKFPNSTLLQSTTEGITCIPSSSGSTAPTSGEDPTPKPWKEEQRAMQETCTSRKMHLSIPARHSHMWTSQK